MRFRIYHGAVGASILSFFGTAIAYIGIVLIVAGIFGEAGPVGEWLPSSLIMIALGIFMKWRAEKVADKTLEKKQKKLQDEQKRSL